MDGFQRHIDNPAKTYLRRYQALVIKQESLIRAINAAYDRAYSCTSRLKAVHVTGGSGAYDRIGEDVATILDETDLLEEMRDETRKALAEILRAIAAVPDEMQRTVLTLRYVEGLDWLAIQEKIGYERTQTLVIHGRALWKVNEWMRRGKNENVDSCTVP